MDSIPEVAGSVKGRLRPDGSIDVRLDASRRIGAVRSGHPRLGWVRDGGNDDFTVRPGETVEMVLPPASGRSRFTSGTEPTSHEPSLGGAEVVSLEP